MKSVSRPALTGALLALAPIAFAQTPTPTRAPVPGASASAGSPAIRQIDEGIHDDYAICARMALVDPASVRLALRAAKGKDTINGVKLSPLATTQANARRMVERRVDQTVEGLNKVMAAQK